MDQEVYYQIPEKVSFAFDRKKLLCIVKSEQYNDQAQSTLQAISKAIKIDISKEVEVIVLSKGMKISAGGELSKFDVAIFFGVNPADIGLNIDAKLYRILSMESIKLLVSHNLIDIAADKNKKMYLWKCLQLLFSMG